MADNYLSGKTGFVTVNGVTFPFAKWRLSMRSGKPKVTNFTTAGFQKLVGGVHSATISLEGAYNYGNMPLVNNSLYTFSLGWASGIYITGDFVVDIDLSNDVEDAPRVTVSGESSGPFTISIN